MHRFVHLIPLVGLVALVVASAAGGAHALAQGADDTEAEEESKVWVTSCAEVSGVCVHAAERQALRTVQKPDRSTPPTVVCVYYPYGKDAGWEDPEGLTPVPRLVLEHMYTLDCHFTADGRRVAGYARIVVHREPGRTFPGGLVTEPEVARHAISRLGLEAPVAAVAPSARQIVGTETWFAVTSKLHGYPERSAQAGSTWATVRANFTKATWDFGTLGQLGCTSDAARVWKPSLPRHRQSSNCTKIFERTSGPDGLAATVTVTWRIDWRSSKHDSWRFHSYYSLSNTAYLDVSELQAVIR